MRMTITNHNLLINLVVNNHLNSFLRTIIMTCYNYKPCCEQLYWVPLLSWNSDWSTNGSDLLLFSTACTTFIGPLEIEVVLTLAQGCAAFLWAVYCCGSIPPRLETSGVNSSGYVGSSTSVETPLFDVAKIKISKPNGSSSSTTFVLIFFYCEL